MRLLLILLASVLSGAGALASAQFAQREGGVEPAEDTLHRAELTLSHDAVQARALLTQACTRDVHVERLLLELSAGASEVDARAPLAALQRLTGGQLSLYVQRADKLQLLSSSQRGGGPHQLAELRCAERARCVEGKAWTSLQLLDACVAARGSARLWLVRSLPLATLWQSAQLPLPDLAPTSGSSAAPGALRVGPQLAGGELWLRPRSDPARTDRRLSIMLLVSGGGLLFGALLGVLLTRKRPVDEQVLAAIEHAAKRVAQGDLSSQIGLSVGGRADQTLRSFDRMTAELRDMRIKLAEAERAAAWQDMARRIAHEIKNPLSPIKMAIETLRKAHQKRLASFDEIFEESTHAIHEEVARMEHIVREFSEFARLPRARPGALDLVRFVHDTAALYAREGVFLALPEPSQGLHVHADREQLAQVLINLLANAFDAVRERSHPQVRVSLSRADGQVQLTVEDNGPGVAEGERERIFEPYVTGKTQGTGLGLSIARRIVLDHGGSIAVSASVLGGARFVVSLPEPGASAA